MTCKQVKRGDIFLMNFHNFNNHLICGKRPCVVVSNDIANRSSQTITVVPLTSKKKKALPTHVAVIGYGLMKPSIALTEQVCTVDKIQLISKISHIDDDSIMKKISKSLEIQLDVA